MKLSILSCFLLFVAFSTHAQTVYFKGTWQLSSTVENGEVNSENTKFVFADNGTVSADNFEIGKWNFKQSAMTVELKTGLWEGKLNGEHKVEKLSKKELVFSKNGLSYRFKRVDIAQIIENNKKLNIVGIWKLNHEQFVDIFLQFEVPNKISIISADINSTSKEKGEWSYLPETNELEISGIHPLSIFIGKSRIKDLNDIFLALVRPQETLIFDKVNTLAAE